MSNGGRAWKIPWLRANSIVEDTRESTSLGSEGFEELMLRDGGGRLIEIEVCT